MLDPRAPTAQGRQSDLPLVIAIALFFVVILGANLLRLAVRLLRPGR